MDLDFFRLFFKKKTRLLAELNKTDLHIFGNHLVLKPNMAYQVFFIYIYISAVILMFH